MKILFEGVDRKDVDFSAVFAFAAEVFTHLVIACTCYDCYSAVSEVPDNSSSTSPKSRRTEIRRRDTPFRDRIHIGKY